MNTETTLAIARHRALALAVAGAIAVVIWGGVASAAAEDPLPSWNATDTKRAIVDFEAFDRRGLMRDHARMGSRLAL